MAGVGTEKVFENDKVIVWNFVLPAGEETPMHTHERAYMWYAIEGAPLQIFDESGKDLGTLEVPNRRRLFTQVRRRVPGSHFGSGQGSPGSRNAQGA